MDVQCPQCGNPNLDVDAENSVVYCKKCGFAVKVDPQTGNVTPLSQGGAQGGMPAQAPAAYQDQPSERSLMGMDPFTFFMLGTAILLLAIWVVNLDIMLFAALEIILLAVYWFKR